MTETERDDRITETMKAIEIETKAKERTPFRLTLLSETLRYLCELK